MRFALSPEQRDFADSLRKMCDAAGTPAVIRNWNGGGARGGRALIRQLAGAGALGLAVAEEYDGMGAETIDLVVACREFGRAAVPGPVIETAAVIPALLQALDDSGPARRWLPSFAEGEALGTIALSPQTPALDADSADVVLVVDGDKLCTARPGDRIESVDAARRLYTVSPDEVVAQGDSVLAAAETAFDAGALAAAAQLLGAGNAMLATSVAYVIQRHQFGQPIGRYQAIKHHLADAKIGLDMAEPLLYRAALSFGTADRARDVSAAKFACAEAAYRTARIALQVHGAIGYTAECDLSLWLTKVTALRSAWGTADFHRARIAAALRTPVAAGA
ncbi:acyl-CoA dehydrogenase family protein [Nocardia nova]|jgi:alkylation response protein AidB-like acyl-CoA dehydrogenase|uniref:acyl-CoA dehydrogenase family protein n=1 Tax=Nocardia nova TaxID=37330 RepID=UPI00189533E5|nr:acyl-CoA dehydrogenase family protein [Nocardia nova]MBF6144524.1 acyl-CoA/acyl-ACP dehydrogenase [Nocardia nova]MDN2499232.1 acyl-CoA dehydrogenase [Nocardia nova]